MPAVEPAFSPAIYGLDLSVNRDHLRKVRWLCSFSQNRSCRSPGSLSLVFYRPSFDDGSVIFYHVDALAFQTPAGFFLDWSYILIFTFKTSFDSYHADPVFLPGPEQKAVPRRPAAFFHHSIRSVYFWLQTSYRSKRHVPQHSKLGN